ncbi:hypothetical protein PT974_10128 [Cladobotryum mycophilum]|uniref:DUF5071 domain-containing protein n=1 Tax=Cladobotryum mycophilum TaxID=491253 RepID=A0ABR0S902_9HYPO
MAHRDDRVGKLPDNEEIESCDAAGFAALVPSLLLRLSKRLGPESVEGDEGAAQATTNIIISRSAEPPTIAVLSSAIINPIKTSQDFHLAWIVLGDIIGTLPLQSLSHYRQALQTLANRDPNEGCPQDLTISSLIAYAKDLILFVDSPDLAWAPKHKADDVAIRSLTERVHSAEQMKPHVPDLLSWLADINWPPYTPCVEQLARFPEATVEPIRDVLSSDTDDVEWLMRILEFLQNKVPVWPLWEGLRPQLEGLIEKYGEARDEPTEEMVEVAKSCMRKLHLWTVLKAKGVETI